MSDYAPLLQALLPCIGSIVKEVIQQNPNPKRGSLFSEIWKSVSQSAEINELLALDHVFGETQLSKNEIQLLFIFHVLRAYGFDPHPQVRLSNPHFFEEFALTKRPAVICSVHTGFALMPAILASFGRQSVIVSSDGFIQDILGRSNAPHDVELIPNNLLSLLRLRDVLLAGKIGVCAVDYSDGQKNSLISLKLFKFVGLNQFPLYYFKSRVDDLGLIWVELAQSNHFNEAMKNAEEFIAFINAGCQPKRELVIS